MSAKDIIAASYEKFNNENKNGIKIETEDNIDNIHAP